MSPTAHAARIAATLSAMRILLVLSLAVAACTASPAAATPTPTQAAVVTSEPTSQPAPQPTPEPSPTPEPQPEAQTFAGEGDRVSDPFELPAGDYRLDWVVNGSDELCLFSAGVTALGGNDLDGMGTTIAAEPDRQTTGAQIDPLEGGRYVWEVEGDECLEWRLTLTLVK